MKRRVIAWLAAFAVAIVAAGAGAAYWDRSSPATDRTVVIPQGSTFSDARASLVREGVVAHPLLLRILARLRGVEGHVEAGEYAFPAHESTGEVLDRIVSGQGQIARWLTVPEGYTAREIAQTLATRGLGNARDYVAYFAGNSIDLYGTRTRSLEGYLFPNTYLLPIPASPEVTARIMVEEFQKELPADAQARAHALGLTVPEVITVASLVEREAQADDERPLIASVIYNRLRRKMPLQVDASIEYALPHHVEVITRADLSIDSPYNTYRNAGLPPTPIANPGRPSIVAAFEPARTDYLYYVYKGDGHHAFARTYREHAANVARYLK